MEIVKILTSCFSALSEPQLRRLGFHVENGTPIFCGVGAEMNFFNDRGHA